MIYSVMLPLDLIIYVLFAQPTICRRLKYYYYSANVCKNKCSSDNEGLGLHNLTLIPLSFSSTSGLTNNRSKTSWIRLSKQQWPSTLGFATFIHILNQMLAKCAPQKLGKQISEAQLLTSKSPVCRWMEK